MLTERHGSGGFIGTELVQSPRFSTIPRVERMCCDCKARCQKNLRELARDIEVKGDTQIGGTRLPVALTTQEKNGALRTAPRTAVATCQLWSHDTSASGLAFLTCLVG